MTNRFPLILDPTAQQIKEMPSGDSLDLSGNTISSELIPTVGNTFSVGGVGFEWAAVHATNLYGALQNGVQPAITQVGTITAGQWQASLISTQYGGTGTAIIPAAGSIVYSTNSALQVSAVGTSGEILRSNGTLAPSWVSSIDLVDLNVSSSIDMEDQSPIRFYEGGGGPNYVALRGPDSMPSNVTYKLPTADGSAGEVLQTDGAGQLSWVGNAGTFIQDGDTSVSVSDTGLNGTITFTTDAVAKWEIGNAGHLIPSTSNTYDLGQPSALVESVYATNLYGTIGTATQASITGLGTITSGTWNATIIGSVYGGTGVDNGIHTITLGGSIITAGAITTVGNYGLTITTTGVTSVTLPTSGTLVETGVTTLSSLTSIGTLTSLSVNGTSSLSGDVNLGSLTTHNIAFNGYVSTSVIPTASTKNIGGAATPWGTVYATNLDASSDLTVDGNSTLGSDSADTLTVNALVGSDFIPTGTRSLGNSGAPWSALNINSAVNLRDQADLLFFEASGNGSNYLAFQAPSALASNVTFTLPNGDASTSGDSLVSDASGTLSWATRLSDVTSTGSTITITTPSTGVRNIELPQAIGTSSSVQFGSVGIGAAVTSGFQLSLTGSMNASVTAMAALDVDCQTANVFTKTISANSVFTFSNPPASGSYSFTLILTHTSGSVTWPASVYWPNAATPSLTTGKTHVFTFVTVDGGTKWRGASLTNYTT